MHPDADWAAYVLEGRLLFHTEKETYDCTAGHIAYIPRGTYFRWANPESTAARALMIYTPGGFEGFFREVIPLIKRQAEDVGSYEKTLPDILRVQDKYAMVRREE